ncbi:hypothetical protein D6T64_13170 [Cryobacterium melibiosiphilum]|uniref:Polysaccharide biosynthesis protein n=1 Tax=Cryobacterium melibiosiphilum TaxID=995039 RepID=A0A3A5MP17_9MICO|nr:hypothetical protein [Cryobacterium melibiosiphilum]RJT87806.1 hypothetical protein D6T64_13170 [Cryobacterium melibiosiphilum]
MSDSTRGDRRGKLSIVLIATATVVAGVSGYLVTLAVAQQAGLAAYSVFAVFWAVLYFIVGCLFGLQQEMTRAVSAGARAQLAPARSRVPVPMFVLLVAGLVAVVIAVSFPLWAIPAFGEDQLGLVVPLAVGAVACVAVSSLSGVLSGLGSWADLALIVGLDGAVRLAMILAVLALGGDQSWLAWGVVAPFPITVGIALFVARRRLAGALYVDGTYRGLLWNSSRTMLAAAAMAAMVTGFPALLSLFSAGVDRDYLGALILAITLLRAPLLVPLTAFQSYLLVFFASHATTIVRALVSFLAVVALGTIAFAGLTALWGEQVFVWLFGEEVRQVSDLLVPLVFASGMIAGLFVTGPAVLSRNAHAAYTTGWVVSAVVAVGAVLLPWPIGDRVIAALVLGPAVGLIIHTSSVVRGAWGTRSVGASGESGQTLLS